ncbi:MAG: hypothetical protein ABI232_01595 [Jatrophihabitantaceae bacterium]
MRSTRPDELPRVLVPAVAAHIGVTRTHMRTEVRHGNWQQLSRGVVLTRPDPPTRADWADVGLLLAGRGGAVSGWDAIRVLGVGDRRPPTPQVLVLATRGRSRTIGDVHLRRTDRPFTSWITSVNDPNLPHAAIATLPRAVTDTGPLLPDLGSVRALVASAVQRGRCDLTALAAELDTVRRNDSRWLRQAIRDIGDGARSAAEADAAKRLQRAEVPAFELNVPVVDEAGVLLFVVDVLWRALRAGLEVDSRECHFTQADWLATLDRHNRLTRYGLSLTHYPPRTITTRGGRWVAEVEQWLRTRAAELRVPFARGAGVIAPPFGQPPPAFAVRTRP